MTNAIYNLLSYSKFNCTGNPIMAQGYVLEKCVSGTDWSYMYNKSVDYNGLAINIYQYSIPNCVGSVKNVTSVLNNYNVVGKCFDGNSNGTPSKSQILLPDSSSLLIPETEGLYSYEYDTSTTCSEKEPDYVSFEYFASGFCEEHWMVNCTGTSNTITKYETQGCLGKSNTQALDALSSCSGSNQQYVTSGCQYSQPVPSPSSSSSSNSVSTSVIAGSVVGSIVGIVFIGVVFYMFVYTQYIHRKPMASQKEDETSTELPDSVL